VYIRIQKTLGRIVLFFLPLFVSSLVARAQVEHTGSRVPETAIFMFEGASEVRIPAYPDKALGGGGGVFVQSASALGIEARCATYPIAARFPQLPCTMGLRVIDDAHRSSLVPYLFVGAGLSKATNSGKTFKTILPAQWVPAWEACLGLDRNFGRVSWRVAELSALAEDTPTRMLHMYAFSTGLVIHFPQRE